jgi:hypothetical protein
MSDAGAAARRSAFGPLLEPSGSAPHSLERTRLLLSWLRAQRAVDQCLSELLAAGPAGEQRVGSNIDRVSGLVAEAAQAYGAYRASVTGSPDAGAGTERAAEVIDLVHRSG